LLKKVYGRLDNLDDFVRLEIATALKRDIRVIPVLVDGALMPRSNELPDDLKLLVRRNALDVSHTRFNADIGRLVAALERVLEKADAERKQREEKERLEAERREKERPEAEARQREEQERLETEQREREEKERLAAERPEREEKERLEVEQRKKKRLEAYQREKERLDAEQRQRDEKERLDRKPLEAGPWENEQLVAERKKPRISGLAIASLLCSLLFWLDFILFWFYVIPSWLYFIPVIPAVICGHLARRKIRQNPSLSGARIALAGLIIGYILLALFILAVFTTKASWL
jgi:hypothetical protein